MLRQKSVSYIQEYMGNFNVYWAALAPIKASIMTSNYHYCQASMFDRVHIGT